jgi:Outer membrane efflux protein
MRIAMEEYRKTVLVAFAEVEDGLANYRLFSEQRHVQEKRVEALRKSLSLAETRYMGGITEYLEVLDAQREVFDAELEHSITIQAQLVSLALLYKALGGGWPVASPGAGCCAPAPSPCSTPAPLPPPMPSGNTFAVPPPPSPSVSPVGAPPPPPPPPPLPPSR